MTGEVDLIHRCAVPLPQRGRLLTCRLINYQFSTLNYFLFQVEREKRIRKGKISNLPTSITRPKRAVEKSL